MSLDAGARTAKLQGGEEVEFGKALIATGARVNILHHLEGAQLEGIHYLRALGNSDAIREDAAEAEHVVLIGGSYIGSEVAASLTAKGVAVHDRDAGGRGALADVRRGGRALLPRAARVARGSRSSAARSWTRSSATSGSRAVRTKSGREIECDAVVIGAGVHPDTMLAERGGLEVDNGIVCDSRLQTRWRGSSRRATAAPTTASSTAGGCGSSTGTSRSSRASTPAAACSARSEPYRVVPYFFSDLADWASLEYVGPARATGTRWSGAATATRASSASGTWPAARSAAALSVGRSEDLAQARRLLEAGADVSGQSDALADVDSDLEAIGSS